MRAIFVALGGVIVLASAAGAAEPVPAPDELVCAPVPNKPDHTWLFKAGDLVPDWIEQIDPAHKPIYRLRFGRDVTVVLDSDDMLQVIPRSAAGYLMHDECSANSCDGPSIKGCQGGVHFISRQTAFVPT